MSNDKNIMAIVEIAVIVGICICSFILPKVYNKYGYKKYGMWNAINMKRSIIGIIVGVGVFVVQCFLSYIIMNDPDEFMTIFWLIIGMIILIGVSSWQVLTSKCGFLYKIIGVFLCTCSSLVAFITIWFALSTLSSKSKSRGTKLFEVVKSGMVLWALVPDIGDEDIPRLNEQIVQNKEKYKMMYEILNGKDVDGEKIYLCDYCKVDDSSMRVVELTSEGLKVFNNDVRIEDSLEKDKIEFVLPLDKLLAKHKLEFLNPVLGGIALYNHTK